MALIIEPICNFLGYLEVTMLLHVISEVFVGVSHGKVFINDAIKRQLIVFVLQLRQLSDDGILGHEGSVIFINVHEDVHDVVLVIWLP